MVKLILIFLALPVIGFFALALGLILSQKPLAILAGMPEGEFQAAATATSHMTPVAVSKARLRDGLEVDVRHLPADGKDPPLLILLHGSVWYGQQFDALFRACQACRCHCAGSARARPAGETPGRCCLYRAT